MDLHVLLEKAANDHHHLCPRQVLGVRIGLAGMNALGFVEPPTNKRLLLISETDGCFVDGLWAATNCSVGHRTLRVEDYGKTAAVFVDVISGRAVRVAPAPGIRDKAYAYAPDESRHYFAQLQAYQIMPEAELVALKPVVLKASIADLVSRPGVRVNCGVCGEEIINERELRRGDQVLCRACAEAAYYEPLESALGWPSTIRVCAVAV